MNMLNFLVLGLLLASPEALPEFPADFSQVSGPASIQTEISVISETDRFATEETSSREIFTSSPAKFTEAPIIVAGMENDEDEGEGDEDEGDGDEDGEDGDEEGEDTE